MDDLISRQAAIDALGELPTFTQDWSCNTWMYTDDVYNAIKELPPIQPKRGRWHYSNGKPATIGKSFGVICDQCGTESEYCTNFCGECGADMREVINSQPTIQPEIVRCEECLYRKICSWEKQGAKFCSFAERREVTT